MTVLAALGAWLAFNVLFTIAGLWHGKRKGKW